LPGWNCASGVKRPAAHNHGAPLARDQQKWIPVLRPIARQLIDVAHDLSGEVTSLRRIMRWRAVFI
jgi:hypothetical protein